MPYISKAGWRLGKLRSIRLDAPSVDIGYQRSTVVRAILRSTLVDRRRERDEQTRDQRRRAIFDRAYNQARAIHEAEAAQAVKH